MFSALILCFDQVKLTHLEEDRGGELETHPETFENPLYETDWLCKPVSSQ